MKAIAVLLSIAGALSAQDAFRVKVTGHGKPAIFIPGLSSSGETFDTTVARYQDRYECHVLTLAGFAGVPAVEGPFMEKVREGVARYVQTKKMVKPVIVGHSLGGTVALDLAAHYPDLPGRLVILDSYPFLMGVMDPGTTPDKARETAAQMRGYLEMQSQDQWERYIKSGVGTRSMVDLREAVAKIRCPVMVLATYVGFPKATRETVAAALRRQYEKLTGVLVEISDRAHHFLMWDDPDWMFAQLDRFLK
jgi:N-formylmaleamate deformylase